MAGQLTIDTLKASTGPNSVNNAMTGIPKAWGSYAYQGGSAVAPVLNSAFNMSSITRTATGAYTLAFTTAMPNALYSVNITGNQGNVSNSGAMGTATTKSTTNFTVQVGYGVFTQYDFGIDFAVFSS